MSFSFQVANGDLVQSGSQMAIVSGSTKLQQDMTLWLAERIGIDQFHPSYGSNLENYIGGIINYNTQSMVYSEIMRVLDNYQKLQFNSYRQNPNLFSLAELLYSINSVNVTIGYDSVGASISVSNAQQQNVTATATTSATGA
jgi:hypothetical protein